MDALPGDLFLDAHARASRRIVLDLDATDDPLHGGQEGRFFHGYRDLPLYMFCGEHHLCARPRPSNIDGEWEVSRSGWQWDFGDGGLSRAKNPNQAGTAPGLYDVALQVTDPTGKDSQFERMDSIGVR